MAARPRRDKSRPRKAPNQRPPETPAIAKQTAEFPVVAIGASAGGLDAFRTLLAALPADGGSAFILVQHLDPNHESKMVELLSAYTKMPVQEVRDGVRIEPNHVYVIPPGRYIAAQHGTIRVSSLPARELRRMPFDFLLQSMAEAFGARAVCVVLSGTAADGSVGANAIKSKGGLVIVQDPEEAEYDGMPLSAIATGAVDLALPLAKIPEALAKYAGHPMARLPKSRALPAMEEAAKIIELVRSRTAHDFALYKTGTLVRRIERRMGIAGVADADDYLKLIERNRAEFDLLANDLLINVTCFFRDPKVFELLKEKIVPDLVREQPPDRPIRAWVAGCSTGEEAYSIAILFLEAIAAAKRTLKLQIFATDIDEPAIAVAREGLYPASIESDVQPDQLKRYFTAEGTSYRVSRELRSCIAFSVHDVMADAPFSRLDLVSCRNLLIYLRPEAQRKILSLFHFALRVGGVLVLGTSETVGDASDSFEPIASKQRVYRHMNVSRPGEVEIPLGRGEAARALWPRTSRPPLTPSVAGVNELAAQRLLLESYAPASVLVNRKHQALYFFGPVDRYLKVPEGVASLDLLGSAREGLRPAIRTAFEKALRGRAQAVTIANRVKRGHGHVAVTVTARAVKSDGEDRILLSFADVPARKQKAKSPELPRVDSSRAAQLEQDLDVTRKDLEVAIRDRETAEEELRAVNEEAMSVNEEFQTTNEELETSKEELQSLNEELMALNSQLQDTVSEYQSVANDFENILNSSQVATLFLDDKLNIRFFTPAAKKLFSVIPSDVGRPLADLARHFADGNLFDDARTVLSNLVPLTREVLAEDDTWYTCRVMPYRTKENRIEGVVITFVDISERKLAELALHAAKEQAESANLGKSRFLAAASHDLRQPLQTLSLLQGLLSTKIKDKDAVKLVGLSQEAVTAMTGMLNTLLNINQLEAGVIRPELSDFPIDDILERLKSEFSYHTQNRGLDWRVRPCRLSVHSDSRLLEQMMRNLLSNAVKYTKKGGVLLGCRRRGSRLRVEIWDTGLGIPVDQLKKIFQEFHQIDNPGQELGRGLGLGLAIVQRLGELLGHTVDVRSRVGRGSVFSIDVPLAAEMRPAAPKRAIAHDAKTPHRTGLILIVEDDPALRESLGSFLRGDGHRALEAADGDEAIDVVARQGARPDAVVVDFNLPGRMNGLEVMARLRQAVGHALPALVLTGDISTQTLSEIDRLGYVHGSKPMQPRELSDAIGSLLSEKP